MSYDFLFQKANQLYTEGALNQAEQLYRTILESMPENPDVLNMLGLIAEAKGLPNEAVDYFYKALKSAPNHLPICFNLAVSLASAEHLREAVDAYQKVLAIKPDLKEAHNNLGGLYERLGKTAKARSEYQEALNIDKNYLEAAVNLAAVDQDKNQLTRLAQDNPQTALPLYYLAKLELKNQNPESALRHIKEALSKTDASAEIFLLAGEIFLQTGDEVSAAEAFRRTLKFNPKSVPALINLGVYENNENLLKEALNIEPDNAEAHADYANLLYKQKRPLEALEEYRKAVVLKPDLPELSNNLGLILKDIGEYEQALDLFLDAFMKNKQTVDYSINLAETLVLFHQQSPERAAQIAQIWANAAPDNPFAAHTLNAFRKSSTAEVDKKYAKALFDAFASSYDKTMDNIKYNVINKIKDLKIHLQGNILDLGCGTGIAGKTFYNNLTVFTGIDISRKMLDIAHSTGAYKYLYQQDITEYLQENNLKYDFILALDVVDYIENFEKIAKLAKRTPFLFTIENADSSVKTLTLMPNGRYKHNPTYIENILKAAGYHDIKKYELTLRQENTQDVAGTLFYAI